MNTDPENQATDRPEKVLAATDIDSVRFADEDARRRTEPLLTPEQAPSAWRLVKRNASRSVWRHADGEGVLYFKHFHNPSLAHRLKRLLGRGGGIREMRYSRYLSRRGVPVPQILAVYSSGSAEWLISEGIEPAQPADEWHAERLAAGDHAAIRQATVALARLIGKMHAQGVIHRDLHCGNVLIPEDSPDRPVLMDLHRMSRRRRISRHSRAANLAQLFSDRRLWTTRTQRLRFLKHYLQAAAAEGTLVGWVRLVEPLARRHSRRLNAKRERRIFSSNRYFAPLRVGRWRGHVVLASKRRVPGSQAAGSVFTSQQWQQALADIDGLFTGPGVEVIKDSRSSFVVRRKLRL